MAADEKWAIIETGGKQYRVKPNSKLVVEKVSTPVGELISFDQVLAIGAGDEVKFGDPFLSAVKVEARVLGQVKDRKRIIFKKRRRKGYVRKAGHRQQHSELLIEAING